MREPLRHDVETVFLDAGNTLISMDYAWIAAEFAGCGLDVSATALARAEAAARPETSRYVAGLSGQSGPDAFVYYLNRVVERLPVSVAGPAGLAGAGDDAGRRRDRLVRSVAAALKRPGGDHRLWSVVLDGVPAALEALRATGRQLVVVSNSDGSVERALTELGLATLVDAILDSEIVGFEKPDPRFFAHALAVAGARAATTLHVGDMYFQDVLGARGAGIEPVLLDPYGDWPEVDCPRRRDLAEVAAELNAPTG